MTSRLPTAQGRPRRAVAIIRVSKEGGRGEQLLSPDLQWGAIESHAAHEGIEIVDTVEAIDESGSRRKSAWWPRLDAQIERVEAGELDTILAWEFSRHARNRVRWAVALDRVESAGGRLESATEHPDVTTAAGRFQRGILAEMHAYKAEQLGESWKGVQANRVARGLPANGKPRFGYHYDTERRLHVPDPVTGPILTEAYTRYAAGESFYTLIGWLNTSGVRPVDGYGVRTTTSLWSDRTLRRMMDSGFAAGLLSVHDPDCHHRPGAACTQRVHVPGAHEPLIKPGLWEEYLEQRKGRRQTRTTERSTYLLSGLLHCMVLLPDGTVCGGPMGGSLSGGGHGRGRPRYLCTRRISSQAHTGGSVSIDRVESVVMAWLHELADDLQPSIKREQAASAQRGVDVGRVERQVEAAKGKLVAATRAWLGGQIPELAWPTVREELEGTVRALEGQHAALRAAERRPVPAVVAADALTRWAVMPVAHKRGVLRQLVKRIDVEAGRVQRVDGKWAPRVRVASAWEDEETSAAAWAALVADSPV